MNGQDFIAIFDLLNSQGVKYVVIGGLAARAYSSAYLTEDADICYSRTPENMRRLAAALRQLKATLRGAPKGLPFKLDDRTLAMGMNFTFDTVFGPLDILGEVSGVGTYDDMVSDAISSNLASKNVMVLSLPKLIASKKAAGRPKDLVLLFELEKLSKIRAAVDKAASNSEAGGNPKRNSGR